MNPHSSAPDCRRSPACGLDPNTAGIDGALAELRTRDLLRASAEHTISLSASLRALHGRDIPSDQVNGLRNALVDLRHSCDLILSHIQSTPSTKSTPSTNP